MLRIRNEARWIAEVLHSALELCDHAFVMDDRSTDGTPEICAAIDRVTVLHSKFTGLDEARDKDWLLGQVRSSNPDWVLCIDGDEALAPGAAARMRQHVAAGANSVYALRVLYLWDRPTQVRIDGVYGDFYRPRLFRMQDGPLSFRRSGFGGNFHCSNVPDQLYRFQVRSDAALLHYGYMHMTDRVRKFAWYNAMDPDNDAEDRYRHVVQGDPIGPPADQKLTHAGPLRLEQL